MGGPHEGFGTPAGDLTVKSKCYRVVALAPEGAEMWCRDVFAATDTIAEALAAKPSDPPQTRYFSKLLGMRSGVLRIREVGREAQRGTP